ncbi:hypothetical protein BCR32DRAFT_281937 [Anaeromyces robustus]|uniref:CCHC-type domain-containing protein n=1 Tax=Anaeromyces robustus TaxID=1754192 RepID=A0A1Y1WZI2_9FUNG|nr:hypothetical protein BCR32DRAFT_281937 [Anaeromyces robustus]|eukprot:ORX78805.1 hypothetical protein BCR32DRAFT_281937 [Anaeromyces robustus]
MSVPSYNPTGTKNLLGKNNFKTWDDELYLLLERYNLNKYIEKDIMKKIRKDTIKDSNLNKYIEVRNNKNLVYAQSVTKEMVAEDNLTKSLMANSISEDIKEKLSFKYNTAYEIYKILSTPNKYSNNERKQVILKELDDLKFNENNETMSMFIAHMDNLFTELENLGETKTDREKYDYLFNSIKTNLIYISNMNSYCDNWKKCCEVIIDAHQHNKYLLEKRAIKCQELKCSTTIKKYTFFLIDQNLTNQNNFEDISHERSEEDEEDKPDEYYPSFEKIVLSVKQLYGIFEDQTTLLKRIRTLRIRRNESELMQLDKRKRRLISVLDYVDSLQPNYEAWKRVSLQSDELSLERAYLVAEKVDILKRNNVSSQKLDPNNQRHLERTQKEENLNNNITCFYCKKKGHYQAACPTLNELIKKNREEIFTQKDHLNY